MAADERERSPAFPLAIVGLSCRLPGAGSVDELWSLLKGRVDAVGEVPSDRWDVDYYYHPVAGQAIRGYTRAGGFIPDIDKFDADFFGIAPREAALIDPQQRLALELVWEALDSTGTPPGDWSGRDVGVFMGVAADDYFLLQRELGTGTDPYIMTGGAMSIVANRVSYIYDLHGPSLTVDTACSSSLVALHEACTCLWTGGASAAIVGGFNTILSPWGHIGFSHASMLSPTGRCRAFDAKGDGYVRAEGGGVVVVRPLAEALAEGAPIHAVILATGVNSDGRTSGISLPNAEAQEQLLRRVYGGAGIDPREVAYIEAHGTGTAAGDPQECRALGRFFGAARTPGDPLPIGSIKTNIGHLEAASGMAGLLKVVLSLKHRQLAPNLHFETPNPSIPFARDNLSVVTEQRTLADAERPLTMGVNSFGFGGTNAHAVLRAHVPEPIAAEPSRRRMEPLLISARSAPALEALAGRYRALLTSDQALPVAALCRAAATQRSHHAHRLAVVGRSAADIVRGLDRFAEGEAAPLVVAGPRRVKPARVALVFSGNGSQWLGMGRDLLESEPVFADWLGRVDRLLAPLCGWSVVAAMRSDAAPDAYDRTEIAQPALFALQVGIVEWLRAHGVVYDAAVGHSVGEVAAAYAAGILTLEQSCVVISHRSQAQAVTAGVGKMAAVGLGETAAAELIAPFGARLTIASINSASSVTLAGDVAALGEVGAALDRRGVFFRLLALDYAFHSSAMDPIRRDLLDRLAPLLPGHAQRRFVSTVTGDEVDGETLDADYWWDNVRQPVQFAAAIERLAEDCDLFLEIGPHPVLSAYLRECLKPRDGAAAAVATLRRNEPEQTALWGSLAQCYANGAALQYRTLFPEGGQPIDLPAYPWQRERYWFTRRSEPDLASYGAPRHPLLGYRMPTNDPLWVNRLELWRHPWLRDHVIQGSIVFPAAGYVEMALAAAAQRAPDQGVAIEGLDIRRPLILSDNQGMAIEFGPVAEDGSFQIGAHDISSAATRLPPAVVGRLVPSLGAVAPKRIAIDALRQRLALQVDRALHYRRCAERGIAYGPAFQGVAALWCGDGEALAQIERPALQAGPSDPWHFDPALLDACLQTVFGAVDGDSPDSGERASFLPTSIEHLRLRGPAASLAWCHAVLVRRSGRALVADLSLFDADGTVVGEIRGLQLRRLAMQAVATVPLYHWQAALQENAARRGAAIGMPTPASLAAGAGRLAASADAGLAGALDRLAASFVRLGVTPLAADDIVDVPLLVENHAIAADRAPYLRSLLDLMARHGLATRRANDWLLETSVPQTDPAAAWRTLLARHPEASASLQLLGRCGAMLPAYLRGEADGADIVLPARDFNTIAQFVESDPLSRTANEAVQRVVRRVVDEAPRERRLRLLEIGSAIGPSLVGGLLPMLPEERTEIVHAAPSTEAAAVAEAAYADAPSLRCIALDLRRDVAAQGVEPQSFDLILVARALHEADDVRAALAQLRRLLKPGGLLVLLEPRHSDVLSFVFGMTPSWWTFTDIDLRPDSPLLAPEAWRSLLSESGFAEAAVAVDTHGPNTVLVAVREGGGSDDRMTLPTVKPATWLLFLDDAAGDEGAARLAHEVMRRLGQAGQSVVTVRPGQEVALLGHDRFTAPAGDAAAYRRLIATVAQQGRPAPINLLHLRGTARVADDSPPLPAQDKGSLDLLGLAQSADVGELDASLRLWIVTAEAVGAPGEAGPRNSAHAPLWGVGRTMMNERPALACRLIDLGLDRDAATADALVAELLRPGDEDEIILRGGARFVHRLARGMPSPPSDRATVHDVPPFKLALDAEEGLRLSAIPLPLPGPGEVLVRVRAAGLNFRDVLQRTGLLPEEAFEGGFAGATLGMEFAGEIVAVGTDVSGHAKGDEVFGFAPSAMSSHLVAKASAVFTKTKDWSFAAAATVPVAHLTAFYSLNYLARLRRGERILIHGGAGGVGLAAIQYAQSVGAEIFASAGTAEKRDFLRRLGVDHVVDSRNLGFADEVRGITGGDGVDIVVNSLAGDAIEKGVALLRPYGRFIELGKRDFYANSKLGLAPFRNNIQFFGVDVDRLLLDRPALAAELFQDMARLFADGSLRPLVHRVFPATRAADAFRHMQQSHHVGKVVLSFDGEAVAGARIDRPVPSGTLSLRPDATYLVTGGRRGFGLATAAWLAAKGARHLVLVGRSAKTDPEAVTTLDALRARGINVRELALDVTDGAAVATALRAIAKEGPPLRGVVHAAAVIDDAALANMTPERFRAALGAKMTGAWHLHRLTREQPLDFFVLYSSAVTLIGNPGQVNYMAANLYLEALAHRRRADGLPALVMGWGAIAEVGHVGRNVELAKVMAERLGVVPIAPSRAFDAMEQALLAGHVEVAAAELSWTRLQALPALARAPKYAAMRDQATLSPGADGRADASALVEALAAQTPEAALATVTQLVVKQVAGVMRMSAAKLDVGRSLVDLGMDSLMVVELQLALEQQLGVSLPTLELMDMATVAKLARRVLDEIEKIAPRPGPGNAVDAAGAAANGAARANGAAAANGHGYGNGTGNVDDIDIDTLGDDALDEMLGTLLQDGFERGVATAKERLE